MNCVKLLNEVRIEREQINFIEHHRKRRGKHLMNFADTQVRSRLSSTTHTAPGSS